MTANYFMVTRSGKGPDHQAATGSTFASGSGPTTVAVADQTFTNTFASSLIPWTGSSYNYDTSVSGGFDPTLVSGRARIAIASGINGECSLSRPFPWGGTT